MRKEIIFLFLILIVPLSIAEPSLNIKNESIQPGETLFGTITTTGEFAKQISISDVEFFKGRKQVFFDYDLAYYNGTYFFYTTSTIEGNFTIKIKNILYRTPELKSTTIEKQFKVEKKFIDENKTQTQILSIKPGFVFSSKIPEVILKNNGNTQLDITYNSEEFPLLPDDFRKISFTPEQTFSYLEIKTYETFNVPIIYIPLTSNDNTTEEIEISLRANPSLLHTNLIKYQEQQEIIELVNFAELNLTDIKIITNLSIIQLDKLEEIEQISAKETENLTLTLYSEQEGFIEGYILISFKQDDKIKNIAIPVNAYIFPENTSISNQITLDQSCEELNGIVCSPGQICSGQSRFTDIGEYCCLSTCESYTPVNPNNKPDKPSYTWLWGIVIFIVLGVAGFFIYKKYKNIKPTPVKDKLAETSKLYEKRVKGGLSRT